MKQYPRENTELYNAQLINTEKTKQGSSLMSRQRKKHYGTDKQTFRSGERGKVEESSGRKDKLWQEKASSNYNSLFEKYHSKESLIDIIIISFDNGDIFNAFRDQHDFCYPDSCRGVQQQIKNNIAQIQFIFQRPHQDIQTTTIYEPLSLHNYADMLSSTFMASRSSNAIQQQQLMPFTIIPKSQNSNTKEANEKFYDMKDTKLFLLLSQIFWHRKIKGPTMLDYRAIEIKLEELLDYITHDSLINYHLNEKVRMIFANLSYYSFKTIDQCSLLAILEIAFAEYRNLQKDRLMRIKRNRFQSSQGEHCLKWQRGMRQMRSGRGGESEKGSRRSKLSEPVVRKIIQLQSFWISDLG